MDKSNIAQIQMPSHAFNKVSHPRGKVYSAVLSWLKAGILWEGQLLRETGSNSKTIAISHRLPGEKIVPGISACVHVLTPMWNVLVFHQLNPMGLVNISDLLCNLNRIMRIGWQMIHTLTLLFLHFFLKKRTRHHIVVRLWILYCISAKRSPLTFLYVQYVVGWSVNCKSLKMRKKWLWNVQMTDFVNNFVSCEI